MSLSQLEEDKTHVQKTPQAVRLGGGGLHLIPTSSNHDQNCVDKCYCVDKYIYIYMIPFMTCITRYVYLGIGVIMEVKFCAHCLC